MKLMRNKAKPDAVSAVAAAPGRRFPVALALLALVAVLAGLIYKTRAVDFDAHNEVVGLLRQLKQVDAEWNVDVLRSRTGLNTNYDPVASALPLIASLEETLQVKGNPLWHERAESETRMKGLLDGYKQTMERKTAMIERFKSQNAILRNSSRFLPVAANDLTEVSRGADVSDAQRDAIERSLNALLTSTMTYTQAPDTALREAIASESRTLQQHAAAAPAAVRERTQTLVDHIATVLKQQEASNKVLAELAAMPTAKTIDAISDAHAQEHEARLADQQIYRHALIAYSAFLLALVSYLGWRLFRSYRQVSQELKASMAHLVQSEKMSALGQMVAGIAHEINTPLAYVKGTFDVLKEQLVPVRDLAQRSHDFTQQLRRNQHDTPAVTQKFHSVEAAVKDVVEDGMLDEMHQLLHDGLHGIDQISEIVINLKNFSRLDRARVSEFSVQAGLESTLLLAKNVLKNRVEIRKEYGANVPQITCSPSQINQVFLNIITNAVDALPQGKPGVITLRTARQGKDMVRVEIQDNGSGIPKDVLAKIFDPFFTTKAVGKGTGLGLSISYKIIQEHGGRIDVETELGIGTVFAIVLPTSAVESPAVQRLQEEEDLVAA